MGHSSNGYAKGLKRKVGLKRKTPLRAKRSFEKRGKPIVRKTPMKKISRSQRGRLAKYRPIRDAFLVLNPWCAICIARDLQAVRPSTEVHHIRGRNVALLFDTRFFAASCRSCREWPHQFVSLARELGLLSSASDWNTVPR